VSILAQATQTARTAQLARTTGRIVALRGMTLHIADCPLPIGSLVALGHAPPGSQPVRGEVIGIAGPHAVVMTLGSTAGLRSGDPCVGLHTTPTLNVGNTLLGRVVNGLGEPIDSRGPMYDLAPRQLDPAPLSAMQRARINTPFQTGIRAIDTMTPLGIGQRMGIFAGPGVGKSTLLSALAKHSSCDVAVVALIGERGREVKDFVHDALGESGLKRSVVVASTGDESPLLRVRAAHAACTIAEHFRDQGKHVLLMLDSMTRLAHAQRQIGLSIGEPPTTRGYTPSVFALMARLMERAGSIGPRTNDAGEAIPAGAITGLYTILVEGDEMTEPISDAARGILDGHLMLSRALAPRGHYPAIDVLDSISRVAGDVADDAHLSARRQIARFMARFNEVEDLVNIGAYAKGANAEADVAIAMHPRIIELLQQNLREPETLAASRTRAIGLAVEAGQMLAKLTGRPA